MTDPNKAVPREVGEAAAADLRARLNDELGFYPANLDEESIAEYRREDTEERERHARWIDPQARRPGRLALEPVPAPGQEPRTQARRFASAK